jgi:hypothetical protein
MNETSQLARTAPLVLALATAGTLQAVPTGSLPPLALNWVKIADTTTVAPDSILQMPSPPPPTPLVAGVPFLKFDPPVITEFDRSLAFKGWLTLTAPVTAADDEGVWSTAPMLRLGGTPHIPSLVLREGAPVPAPVPPPVLAASGATFGSVGLLKVDNLQSEFADWTICATNTSLGKVAIANNDALYNIGESGPGLLLSDLRPPVAAGFQLAGHLSMWKRNPATSKSALQRIASGSPATPPSPPIAVGWDTNPPSGSPLSCAGFAYKPNQPARVGSPAISEAGWVAAYAQDTPGVGVSPNHLQLRNTTLGAAGVIVRQGDPAPVVLGFTAAGAKFGIIHNQLLATSDSLTAGGELVAWQMQTMLAPALAKTSLWCKNVGVFNCLAFQNQNAPDLGVGDKITSFYALHAVPDISNPGGHLIIWGAMINGNRVAIYRTLIDASGFMVPAQLIATTVPGYTPVDLFVGGTLDMTSIDRFFSVNVHGSVLFKARVGAPAPAASRNILVTAQVAFAPSLPHLRQVRAQSGIGGTAGLPGGIAPTNFQLATPEQGSHSRGQAIGSQWLAAKALYSAGQGIFFAHL